MVHHRAERSVPSSEEGVISSQASSSWERHRSRRFPQYTRQIPRQDSEFRWQYVPSARKFLCSPPSLSTRSDGVPSKSQYGADTEEALAYVALSTYVQEDYWTDAHASTPPGW